MLKDIHIHIQIYILNVLNILIVIRIENKNISLISMIKDILVKYILSDL